MQPVRALNKTPSVPGAIAPALPRPASRSHPLSRTSPPALPHLCCNSSAGFRLLALLGQREPLMSSIPFSETRFFNQNEGRVNLGLDIEVRAQ